MHIIYEVSLSPSFEGLFLMDSLGQVLVRCFILWVEV